MTINYGDSAFVLISTAMVFLMTPGLAFFYGGMVRRKNVINTMLSSFLACGLAAVLWIIVGYSLSFGDNHLGIVGGFNYLFFNGVGTKPNPISYFFLSIVKQKLGYDDALDAFGCHGIGGIWGGIATGLFASKAVNPALKWEGLVYGNSHLFGVEVLSIVATILFAGGMTFVIFTVIKKLMPVRVAVKDEANGLDTAEHSESAYPAFTGLD